MERPAAGKGKGWDFVGERGGGLGWGELRRDSFDYAQDRLFALERRAQDDGKNKQRRRTGNGKSKYRDSGYARMTALVGCARWNEGIDPGRF
jgi:hypothetical protein